MSKVALITGITGQDGSYLAELLLSKGYEVHGLARRLSTGFNTTNIEHIKNDIQLHVSDLTDTANVRNIIVKTQPDEVYNLAAQSHVGVSFQMPEFTGQVNGISVLTMLETIRSLDKRCKFYQASTSELYGMVQQVPQTEKTPFYPRSPYAVAKLYAYWITVNYRESYDIHASNGILFNHESPRRGPEFVTRKIVQGLMNAWMGDRKPLRLGNLDALRDWGHAKDYVEAMYLLVQQDVSDDYVISSGEQHSVRDFCDMVADYLGIQIEWQGEGLDEVGIDMKTGQTLIEVSEEFYRPAEVNTLLGDCTKAKQTLNWVPKYSFKDLVHEMCSDEFNKNYY